MPRTVEEITWNNGKPYISEGFRETEGCTGRTFEGEALRIVRSGNYKHVRNHVFSNLLGRAEILYWSAAKKVLVWQKNFTKY